MRKYQSKAVLPICMVICAILIGVIIYRWQFTNLMITASNGDIISPGFEQAGVVSPELYPLLARFGTDIYSENVVTVSMMSLIFWFTLCVIIFIHIQLFKRIRLKYYIINILVNLCVGAMLASLFSGSASPIVGFMMVTRVFQRSLNTVQDTIWKYAIWLMFMVFSSCYWMVLYISLNKLKSKLT